MWTYRGQERPSFAEHPGTGKESVWDYPRPPRIELDTRQVVVRQGQRLLAESQRAVRVLETASPPTFYIPPEDVRGELLEPCPGRSHCEWKGAARYWRIKGASSAQAWSYPEPTASFHIIAGYFSFYPALVECYVDGERARPQPGQFYGGWVTDEIVGPFKGPAGTSHW